VGFTLSLGQVFCANNPDCAYNSHMLNLSSRDVQTQYGQFADAVMDGPVCVTRHGRPLYYAVSARPASAELLIGRLLLAFGQSQSIAPAARDGDDFTALVQGLGHQSVDDSAALTQADVALERAAVRAGA
jgi:hypothetical protein